MLLESRASAREAEHRVSRVADGDARAGADVVRAREPAFPRRDDRPRGVTDMQVIAQLLAAEDADRLTEHRSADEVRDGSLDGVPAAVEHGEAQDRDLHVVAMLERPAEDLRRDLARAVPAPWPQLGVLAKRLVALGQPVHLGRARHDVRLARTAKRAEEVHGSHHVDRKRRSRLILRGVLRDHRGKVNDRIDLARVLCGATNVAGVDEVDLDEARHMRGGSVRR